jgi:structure-specific recognition protein 1
MVKGLKDENAPTRPLSAYFQWQNSVRAKVAKTMPEGHTVGDMAKKFSEMWGAMSDNQKKPFITKYQTEKAKFDKKMEKYKTTKDYAKFQKAKEQHKLDSVKSKKFKKDENAPSRPLSAYFLFMNDERDDLVASGMSHTEAMSKCGEMWRNLSAAKKKPYEDKAAAAKAKYQKQVEKYHKTATYKKYVAERDAFNAAKKAELKKMDDKHNPKPKKVSKSKSRSKPRARSRSKSAKRRSAKRSRSRSKKRSGKKAQKRSRSRSKSKKRSGKKKSRSRN